MIPLEPKIYDRKFIKELSSDNIEKLSLFMSGGNGTEIKFNEIYEYKHFLGKGGFGYVVHAIIRETN